jgi:hypothetical protein
MFFHRAFIFRDADRMDHSATIVNQHQPAGNEEQNKRRIGLDKELA